MRKTFEPPQNNIVDANDIPLIIKALQSRGVKVYHTGSREIMDNPPEDSDDDWIVLDDPIVDEYLYLYDFEPKGGENSSGGPNTVPFYNKDKKVNIILCFTEETFNRWVASTIEAKRLKLNDRADRVALFKKFRVDNENNFGEIYS